MEPDIDEAPENIADIISDGDVILVLYGMSAEPEKR